MDWRTFISQMTGTLIWPLFFLVIIMKFRDSISENISRIIKLKLGGAEVELTKGEDIKEAAISSLSDLPESIKNNINIEDIATNISNNSLEKMVYTTLKIGDKKYYSINEIAKELGISLHSARRATETLESKGLIKANKRLDELKNGSKRTISIWSTNDK